VARTRPRLLRRPALVASAEVLLLAGLAYVPLLVTRRGVATPDTKTYLYLDPGKFLSQVASMWDPSVGLGTVTHEYIGYLLPMGPFFWAFHALGVPLWVAQRLWLGSILFAAGAGVLFLCRQMGVRGPGAPVAALAFMLSPYVLQYAGRISVILLPWAGLPWMVAFAARAVRRGGWKDPACFALVVALVSGINASSVIYVGVAPVLWILYAVAVEKEAGWGRALGSALRIGLLTLLVCLWWMAGLFIEGAYGVNVLKYTETIPSTSATSNASEVIRGLGYWYFYGGDRLGPWTQSAVIYTQWAWLLAASYVVPVLAFCSAALVRWRHRAFYVLLVVVGLVLSVGAHPFTHPTPVGGVLKAFMSDTTAGLAMRSTDRATPLIILGLAMLLGAGTAALWRRRPVVGGVTALVVAGLVVAANPALFNGDTIANDFTQPAALPSAEQQAIAHLNSVDPGTRVLAIPGDDFASYRWGNTVDSPQPSGLNRPFVIREQQVMGSIATADTLYGLDDPIQEDTENWNALGPMARLLSAGDVWLQSDTQYEHYGIPQPQLLWAQLQPTPRGLSDPTAFGTVVPNPSSISTLDEQDLAAPANPSWPAPVVTYTVADPRPILRAESDTGAVVVAGDASALEPLAANGLLDTTSAVYDSGTLDQDPGRLAQLLSQRAALVLTDTNRKQAFRWDTLAANTGLTETPGENVAAHDPSDSPVELFPGAPADAKTTASFLGAVNVTASSYGNTVSYTPEDRPYNAIDGDEDTAWRTGVFVPDPKGEWWQAQFSQPVTTDHLTLVQPLTGNLARWLTKVRLSFDGGTPVPVTLDAASRTPGGQTVSFPATTFHTLRITIGATSNDTVAVPAATAVGLSEVRIPGQQVTEVVVMPTDLLTKAGTASQGNRLTLVMTRNRTSPFPPRSDPETTLVREFSLPTTRTFSLSGAASISTLIPDDAIDQLVGRPGSSGSGIVAYSNGRLPGSLTSGAAAALDGNPNTAWQPGLGGSHQVGDWLDFRLPRPVTFDHLNLQVVADGRHSVPTKLSLTTDQPGQGTRTIDLPPIADGRRPGSVVDVPVTFPAIRGQEVRLTVTGARFEQASNYYSPSPEALPLGIAEVGIPGEQVAPVPADVPSVCRSDLLKIDGRPIPVQVVGTTASALDNQDLSVQPCGWAAHGLTLGAGAHLVQTTAGHNPFGQNSAGWNLDQLVLDSAAGGGAMPAAPYDELAASQPGPAPSVRVTSQGRTSATARVTGASEPFELVLGQSVNAGWQAVAHPGPGAPAGSHPVSLGSPTLVDGFANGWSVNAAQLAAVGSSGGAPFTVTLTWAPQRAIWLALGLSAAGLVLCLVLVVLPRRRRRGGDDTGRRWWRPAPRGRHARGATAPADPVPVPAAVTAAAVIDPPDQGTIGPDPVPVLALPTRARGPRPRWWMFLVGPVVVGGLAAAISSPLVGAAAAVATLAGLFVPQVRGLTAALAVGLLVAAAVTVVRGQILHPLPESSNWPAAYESAGVLVWMAAVFLGVDAVLERAWNRVRRRPAP
jgi:hypothetical protein